MQFAVLFVRGAGGMESNDLQKALLGLIGKPVKELVHVDFCEKLKGLGLDAHFPAEVC